MWFRDLDEVRTTLAKAQESTIPIARFTVLYGRAVLGELPPDALAEMLDTVIKGPISPRFAALTAQNSCEICCVVGEPELAEGHLRSAIANGLMDIEWLERCPVLGVLRTRPAYPELRAVVRARADEIWQAARGA